MSTTFVAATLAAFVLVLSGCQTRSTRVAQPALVGLDPTLVGSMKSLAAQPVHPPTVPDECMTAQPPPDCYFTGA